MVWAPVFKTGACFFERGGHRPSQQLWLVWEISGKAGMQPASQKGFALSHERSGALAAGTACGYGCLKNRKNVKILGLR